MPNDLNTNNAFLSTTEHKPAGRRTSKNGASATTALAWTMSGLALAACKQFPLLTVTGSNTGSGSRDDVAFDSLQGDGPTSVHRFSIADVAPSANDVARVTVRAETRSSSTDRPAPATDPTTEDIPTQSTEPIIHPTTQPTETEMFRGMYGEFTVTRHEDGRMESVYTADGASSVSKTDTVYDQLIVYADPPADGTPSVQLDHIVAVRGTENANPEITEDTSTGTVAENASRAMVDGVRFAVTDANGDRLTFTVESDESGLTNAEANARFEVVKLPGDNDDYGIRLKRALDYETKITYQIMVRVDDGDTVDPVNEGVVTSTRITVTVTNDPADDTAPPPVNDGPGVIRIDSTGSRDRPVADDVLSLNIVTADPDSASGLSASTLTYQWFHVGQNGAADADITGATSATYTVKTSDLGKVISLRVEYTDDEGHSESITNSVALGVVANPLAGDVMWVTSRGSDQLSGQLSYAENLAFESTVEKNGQTEPANHVGNLGDNAGSTAFAITGGADQEKFVIVSRTIRTVLTHELYVISYGDYDVAGGQTLDLEIRGSGGTGGPHDYTYVINVNNVNDNLPTITPSGSFNNSLTYGDDFSSATLTGYTFSAYDPDDPSGTAPLAVTLKDNTDRFELVESAGVYTLRIKAGAMFTSADQRMVITVQAEDSGAGSGTLTTTTAEEMVDISFGTPAPAGGPTIDRTGTASVAENSAVGAVVYTVPQATAIQSGALSYVLDPTGDAASFDFDATSRELRVKTGNIPDFETKSSYTVTFTVTEAGNSTTSSHAVTVSVTNVDETDATGVITLMTGTGAPAVGHVYRVDITEDPDVPSSGDYTIEWTLGGTPVAAPRGTAATFTVMAGDLTGMALGANIKYTDPSKAAGTQDLSIAATGGVTLAAPAANNAPTFARATDPVPLPSDLSMETALKSVGFSDQETNAAGLTIRAVADDFQTDPDSTAAPAWSTTSAADNVAVPSVGARTTATVMGEYGVFTILRGGAGAVTQGDLVISYNLAEMDSKFTALTTAQTVYERLTIYADDGTDQSTAYTYVVTIVGTATPPTTNVAPVLADPMDGTVTDGTMSFWLSDVTNSMFGIRNPDSNAGANEVATVADVMGTFSWTDANDPNPTAPTDTYTIAVTKGGATPAGSSTETGYNDNIVGTLGTLHWNTATGAYLYVPDEAKITELDGADPSGSPAADSGTDTFMVIVTDGDGAASNAESLTINVVGVNDRPLGWQNGKLTSDRSAGFDSDDLVKVSVGTQLDEVAAGTPTTTVINTNFALWLHDNDAKHGYDLNASPSLNTLDVRALVYTGNTAPAFDASTDSAHANYDANVLDIEMEVTQHNTNGVLQGKYGQFVFTTHHNSYPVRYIVGAGLDPNSADLTALRALNNNQDSTFREHLALYVYDGNTDANNGISQVVTLGVTFTGVNDAAEVASISTETPSFAMADLTAELDLLTFSIEDVDSNQVAGAYTLTPSIIGTNATSFRVHTVDAPNGMYAVRLASSTSGTLAAGEYTAQIRVNDGSTNGPTQSFTLTVTAPAPQTPISVTNGVSLMNPGLAPTEDDDTNDPDWSGSIMLSGADMSRLVAANPFTVTTNAQYGTFTIMDDGTFTYNVDNSNNTVNALNSGDEQQDTVVVTITYDTNRTITQTINFHIQGADDDPKTVVSSSDDTALTTHTVNIGENTPDTPETSDDNTTTVSFTIADVDSADTVGTLIVEVDGTGYTSLPASSKAHGSGFYTVGHPASSVNNTGWDETSTYGIFSVERKFSGEIDVSYKLFTEDANKTQYDLVQALNATEMLYDILTVYVTDDGGNRSAAYTYTVTIDGVTDPVTALLTVPGTVVTDTVNIDGTLTGGNNAELHLGGAGDDTITTGGGADLVFGGFGNDTINLDNGAEGVIYRYESDLETADGTAGDNWQGTDGADTINNFKRGVDKLFLADISDDGNPVDSFEEFAAEAPFAHAIDQIEIETIPFNAGLNGYITGVKIRFNTAGEGAGSNRELTVRFAEQGRDHNGQSLEINDHNRDQGLATNFSPNVAQTEAAYLFLDDLFGENSLKIVTLAELESAGLDQYIDAGDATYVIDDAGSGAVAHLTSEEQDALVIGNTLHARRMTDDPDGHSTATPAVTYQWNRNGAAILTATGASYTLTEADDGKDITVEVGYTDGDEVPETVTSQTVSVPAINLGQAAYVIDDSDTVGTPAHLTSDERDNLVSGYTLHARRSEDDLDGHDGDVAVTYQWHRDGGDIMDATGSSYVLTEADEGAMITVTVSYTDGDGSLEDVTTERVFVPLFIVPGTIVTDTVNIDGTLTGSSAAELHLGGAGDDTITTGGGADLVYGDLGIDDITLANGAERIIYRYESDLENADGTAGDNWQGTDGADTINNFKRGVDKLYLVDISDDGNPVDSFEEFAAEAPFTHAIDQIEIGRVLFNAGLDYYISSVMIRFNTAGEGAGSNRELTVHFADQGRDHVNQNFTYNANNAVGEGLSLNFGLTVAQTEAAYLYLDDLFGEGSLNIVTLTQVEASGLNLNAGDATYVIDDTGSGDVAHLTSDEQDALVIGNTLHARRITDDPDGHSTTNPAVTYQWNRNGVAIMTETGTSYTLAKVDEGTTITVTVSYTDGDEAPVTITTAAVTVSHVNSGDAVYVIDDSPLGNAAHLTTMEQEMLVVGDELHARRFTHDPDGGRDGSVRVTYQWMRGNADIDGEEMSYYALTKADEGHAITVEVGYTDGDGFPETVTANPVAIPHVDDGNATFEVVNSTGTLSQIVTGSNLSVRKTDEDPDGTTIGHDTGPDDIYSYTWNYEIIIFSSHGEVERSATSNDHELTVLGNVLKIASVTISYVEFSETKSINILVNQFNTSLRRSAAPEPEPVIPDPTQEPLEYDISIDEGESFILNLSARLSLTAPVVNSDDNKSDSGDVRIRQTDEGAVLEFVTAPDYENPADRDGDNVYEFTILDGTTTIDFYVTVNDLEII